MRYDMALDALLIRYRMSEADFMLYVLPRIPESHELDIERTEREMRDFLRGMTR